jgi:hypothetical protein
MHTQRVEGRIKRFMQELLLRMILIEGRTTTHSNILGKVLEK